MTKTNKNENGVRGVIARATAFNYQIGGYVEHFITERFTYLAGLTNGRIEMSMNIAEDQETQPQNITDARIEAVAKTFKLDSK